MKTRKHSKKPKMHIINGYKVLFVPHEKDLLHIECVIRTGFCTETKENSGINHLLEHILVEGWKKCKTTCNSFWDNKGYYVNASTDKTTMNYYIKGLNTQWKDMTEYIATIMHHPLLTDSHLKKEKQAVIDELLTYSNTPDHKLINVFNSLFYKVDGLKYADDWKLQIANLKKINLKHVYEVFDKYYTSQNIMFVVMGDYNESQIKLELQKHLTGPKQGTLYPVDCYTLKHEIVFVKQNIENTKVHIGFPYSKNYNYVHINSCVRLLHILFFNEFRTKKSLLYDIEVYEELNACGTTVFIEFDVQTSHAKTVIELLFKYIRYLQKTPIKDIDGFKNQEIYNYMTNKKTMMTYYTSLIYSNAPLYTLEDIIRIIRSINPAEIMKLMNELFNIDHALCVYQSKKDLHLTFDKL